MFEILDYLIEIIKEDIEAKDLKEKIKKMKSILKLNYVINDVNISFTEKEIEIFKEGCLQILNENPYYGRKTKKVFEAFVKEKNHPMDIVYKIYSYMLTNDIKL